MSVTLTCPVHPRYKALRKPRANCFCCREIYAAANTVRGFEILMKLEGAT